MTRPSPNHAPAAMTRAYNRTMALSKIDTARIETLTEWMMGSIARTHKVPLAVLEQRLAERKAREGLL